LGDVNNDGIPELLVGIQNGGLRWLQGAVVSVSEERTSAPLNIFPNPVQAGATLALSGWRGPRNEAFLWLDLQGRIIEKARIAHHGAAVLQAPSLPGIYLLTTQPAADRGTQAVRVIVQ